MELFSTVVHYLVFGSVPAVLLYALFLSIKEKNWWATGVWSSVIALLVGMVLFIVYVGPLRLDCIFLPLVLVLIIAFPGGLIYASYIQYKERRWLALSGLVAILILLVVSVGTVVAVLWR